MFRWNTRRQQQPLDRMLMKWNDCGDVLCKRELLQSVCVQGASGSGKTSAVGYQLAKALIRDEGISGLILASKPGEDRRFWQKLFAANGRADALIVVAPDQPHCFNWLDWEITNGADARDIASLIMTAAETLKPGEHGGKSAGKSMSSNQRRICHGRKRQR